MVVFDRAKEITVADFLNADGMISFSLITHSCCICSIALHVLEQICASTQSHATLTVKKVEDSYSVCLRERKIIRNFPSFT